MGIPGGVGFGMYVPLPARWWGGKGGRSIRIYTYSVSSSYVGCGGGVDVVGDVCVDSSRFKDGAFTCVELTDVASCSSSVKISSKRPFGVGGGGIGTGPYGTS